MKETLEAARLLVQLLEDPHPGLITWAMAVRDAIDRINKSTGVTP